MSTVLSRVGDSAKCHPLRLAGNVVILSVLACLILCVNCSVANAQETSGAITAADVLYRVNILASDSLEGRRSGELGERRAAEYIAREFSRSGLLQFPDAPGYLQPFDFSERALDTTKTGRTYSRNVVGYIQGGDAKLCNEYIVIGAHFDHLGLGGRFSLDTARSIHYGADDNASGTAGVLELAEYFSNNKKSLKRSIIFVAFSGEELGLFGSKHFADHLPVPRTSVVAMINMDMIGRMKENTVIIEGMGTSSDWPPLIDKLKAKERFTLRLKPDGVGPSDHTSFYRKDIPVLFFFSGLHSDYHRPSDVVTRLNALGEAGILDLVKDVTTAISTAKVRPTFTKVPEDTTKRASTFRVYVGGVPDYGYDGEGVRIDAVTDGSPAQKAALAAGDVIVHFGELRIKNIYDYTNALSKHTPGDVVTVQIMRAGELISLPLTLGSRKADH